MKFTKYGHACMLIEEDGTRILIDPGAFSHGFESLTELDALLITHEHPDHFVLDTIQNLLSFNTEMRVLADADSARQLEAAGIAVTKVKGGETHTISGVTIETIGDQHAEIHTSVPVCTNVGYLIAGKLFFPGDALTLPEQKIEVLAIPSVAPWSKVSETIDYLLAVKPKVAIPVHDAIAAVPEMYADMLGRSSLAAGIEIRVAQHGIALSL